MEVTGAAIRHGILTVTLEQQVPESAKPKKISIAREPELTKIKK
jgi:HSP20 family molecular chaperone IbpA